MLTQPGGHRQRRKTNPKSARKRKRLERAVCLTQCLASTGKTSRELGTPNARDPSVKSLLKESQSQTQTPNPKPQTPNPFPESILTCGFGTNPPLKIMKGLDVI